MTVRTRFAPSPTGEMHIGGVRTALFNWLFARRHKGQFILRIDDTDRERHQNATVQPILDAFRWLRLDYDEGPEIGGPHQPYFQSERTDLYKTWVDKLLESGGLYKDYSTAEERDADKKESDYHKRPYRFREKRYTAEQISGRPYCIRLKVTTGRALYVDDEVRGKVEVNTNEIGDFVVARMDGSPLYSFATVVDDATMKISHVIRSEEHLTNTFPQLLIYEAMGMTPPTFAHLPYVAAPKSRKKMSKRDGGASLQSYKDDYLPDAMVNYLARLGWSLDDRAEFMTRGRLIENFSLDRVVKSAASHDPDKLFWLQSEHMKAASFPDKYHGAKKALGRAGLVGVTLTGDEISLLSRVIIALGDRLKKFSDVVTYGGFFFKKELEYDQDSVKKRLLEPEGASSVLSSCLQMFASSEATAWTPENLEAWVRQYSETSGHKMGLVVNALRVAVSGQAVGPGVYDILLIFGRDEVVRRIRQTIDMISEKGNS